MSLVLLLLLLCFRVSCDVNKMILEIQLASEGVSPFLSLIPPAGTASSVTDGVSFKMSSSSLSCDKEHPRTGWACLLHKAAYRSSLPGTINGVVMVLNHLSPS